MNQNQIKSSTLTWMTVHRLQLASIAIGLLSFLCYLPSIGNEFVFDDVPTLINNKDIRPEKVYFTKIFFNDYWGTPINKEESHKSYRPLTILTFRWNYMVHGLEVTGYHAVNNILHSIVSILFFRLCFCYTHQFWESVISSTYFAIHPIHVDAVASIVGRAELLSALFSLSGLLYYCSNNMGNNGSYNGTNGDKNINTNINHNDNNKNNNNPDKSVWIVFILTLLGTFCKEQASTTLIICIFHEALFKFKLKTKVLDQCKIWIDRGRSILSIYFTMFQVERSSNCKSSSSALYPKNKVPEHNKSAYTFYKNTFYLSIGFITIGCLRFAIMNNKLPSFNRLDNPARTLASPYRQLNYAYIWAYNCWLLLYPFNLSCDWSSSSISLITSLLDPKNVIILALVIATLLLLLHSDTISWMGLGLMIITFLPASNILFPLGFVIAERVLYLPSMGFSIIIARGFRLLYSSMKSQRYWVKVAFHLVTFICASSLTLKTLSRCYEWQNELSLFSSGLHVNPGNVKLLNNVGRLYESQGNLSLALDYYEKAVSLQPDDVRGYLNLGKALTKAGRLEEAERCYRKALDLIPRPNEISLKLNPHHRHNSHDNQYNDEILLHGQHLSSPPSSSASSASSASAASASGLPLESPSLSKTNVVIVDDNDDDDDDDDGDKSTRQSIITTTGRLTFPGYERLVNQGTNTDYMINYNNNNNNNNHGQNDGLKVEPISPSSTSASASSRPTPPMMPTSTATLGVDDNLATITINHLQGLLNYASLISRDESRIDEANRMFSTIASMRPDYSVTYSTWIQSMMITADKINKDAGSDSGDNKVNKDATHDFHDDDDSQGETLLSQITLNHNQQTDPDILYNMAILFNNHGNIENALNLFDQALSIDPYHEETLLTSARIIKDNELIGDYLSIAMERLETLVSMGKADETIYFDLGMLSIRSGLMSSARRYFAKAIELKPTFTEALFNMALLLYKEEKPKDALPFLKFLLQTEETHGKALLLMIAINSSNNDADEQNDLPKSQQLSSQTSSSSSSSS